MTLCLPGVALDFETLWWGAAIVGVVTMVYRLLRYGGFRDAMYGAEVERELGEVEGNAHGGLSVTVRVHQLAGAGSDRALGIEMIGRHWASRESQFATLSRGQARQVIGILKEAIEDHGKAASPN